VNELLFLAHRIPYPPNKGDKLRSFNLLKQLRGDYRVHVGAFIDDDEDWRYVQDLQALAGECYFARLTPWRAKLRSLPALWGDIPLSLPYYRDSALQAWVDRILTERPVRRIIVFSGTMAQYIDHSAYDHLHRIIDFVDVDSDKWRQYADSQSWPLNWIYRREARALLKYERRVASIMDASVFVSTHEAELFKRLAPEAVERVWDIHNGVDVDYFNPRRDYPSPYALTETPIVFTGAMDYWANVDAVTWFVREVFPEIRQRVSTAYFYIVGARPESAVRELAQSAGVKVTGAVKDIRPYLAHAHVAVAPLRIARGVQNKVLEAMAMATPVVVTPQALDGILCEPDREILVAADAVSFAERVCDVLLGNTGDTTAAARHRVESDYSWESNLRRFEALLEGTPMGKADKMATDADNALTKNSVPLPQGTTVPPEGGGVGYGRRS
jgi:sugar transferase (PEP-CTERM/EpsH1 system associated)